MWRGYCQPDSAAQTRLGPDLPLPVSSPCWGLSLLNGVPANSHPLRTLECKLTRTKGLCDVITGFLVTQMVKTACNAGDPVSIPGSGRSPGEGNGCPLQYSGESHGQRSLAGCSLWGCRRNQGEAPELRSVWIRVTHRNKGADTRGSGLGTHHTVCSPTERVQGRTSTAGRGAVGLARPKPGHRVMNLQAHGWSPALDGMQRWTWPFPVLGRARWGIWPIMGAKGHGPGQEGFTGEVTPRLSPRLVGSGWQKQGGFWSEGQRGRPPGDWP